MINLLRLTRAAIPGSLRVKLILAWCELKSLWKYGDRSFPSHIWIETVTQCNRSCWYCPNAVKPIPEQFMSAKVFSIITDRLREIDWTGPVGYHYLSEPLLHPHIVELVAQTKAALPKSLPIIFTNGDFLTVDLAKRLKAAGLAKCSITRHKPVKPGWDAVIGEVCALDRFLFEVFELQRPDLINFAGVIRGLKNQPQNPRCMSPKRVLPIRMNGDISLCCCDYQQQYTFGNVLTHSIRELWPRAYWKQRRDNLIAGFREFEICRDCTGTK